MHPLLIPELIAQVADNLASKEAARFSQVCRTWNVAFTPIVWRNIIVDERALSLEPATQALTNNAHLIRHLTFWDLALFSQFSPPCTRLTDLVLIGAVSESLEAEAAENWRRLTQLICNNPHLRTVRISTSGKLATTEFWSSLQSCSSVHLSGLKINRAQIRAFWDSCKNVQVLDIGNLFRLVGTTSFFEEAQEVYPQLRRFVLDSVLGSPIAAQIMFMRRCPNLESFAMDCRYPSPQQGLPTFIYLLKQGYIPRLESLRLTHSVQDHVWASCLRAMARTRSLDCTRTEFGPLAFQELASHFTNIQTLRLSDCRHVDSGMVQTLLESCPMLKALWAPTILATHIQQGRPWISLCLRRLSVFVEVQSSAAEEIRNQSWAVFLQLARLKRLVSLSIGGTRVAKGSQGLDLRLQSGMGQLEGLAKLEELSFINTKQDMGPEDISWMRVHFCRLMRVQGQCNRNGEYCKQPPLTPEGLANTQKPMVLIVGAGIGGLTLGLLLKRGGVPFQIYERAKEIRPLGSAMLLGSNVTTLLQQLGLYEEFQAIGKPVVQTNLLDEHLQPYFTIGFPFRAKYAGGDDYILTRPDLYEILFRQIPKENIHLGKRILSFEQNKDGVIIRCTDNATHHGDILVGSDGAHSAVRQHLFHVQKKKKLLPKSDDVPLPFSTVCLVGQTVPLDPEEYPLLKTPHSVFNSILGQGSPYSWNVFTTVKNTFCFIVVLHLNDKTAKANDAFRNSEWGPEAAESMCKDVRHLKVPGGKDGKDWTMGDIIDLTPKELITKAMLEEKLFTTWYGGRTVLLGDACHKFNPAGAAGALTAMHDAVALANWICALHPKKPTDIHLAFKEYYKERFPIAKETFENSQLMSKLVGKDVHALVVKNMLRRLPAWLWKRMLIKGIMARPQASFLPLIEDKGTLPPMHQPSLYKTLPLLEKRAKDAHKDLAGAGAVAV